MSETKWSIEADEYVHCNCAYGCPCQFGALPTHGHCRAVAAFNIRHGHHGDVTLDGLKFGVALSWPGAIHEGHGEAMPFIDERATPAQRDALLRIIAGEDTEPGATMFQVFSTTLDTVHEPVFAPIDIDVDIEARQARVDVPGLVESRGEPLLNPVTGIPHRASIHLPEGFEYDVCEVGRGWTTVSGAMPMDLKDTHAQFANLHLTQGGVANHH